MVAHRAPVVPRTWPRTVGLVIMSFVTTVIGTVLILAGLLVVFALAMVLLMWVG